MVFFRTLAVVIDQHIGLPPGADTLPRDRADTDGLTICPSNRGQQQASIMQCLDIANHLRNDGDVIELVG
jgi:hypothetical protein